MSSEDRRFVSPDVMSPMIRAKFLNLEINGNKIGLSDDDLIAIEKMRIGCLTLQYSSGCLVRAPFTSILAALEICHGNLATLQEMGEIAKEKMETTEKTPKPGNVLLAVTNAQMAKRNPRKPSKPW